MSKVLLLLLGCVVLGCATHRALEFDARHPPVSFTTQGVKFGDELVRPEEVAEMLEDYDIPHDRDIPILLEPDVKDIRSAHYLLGMLRRSGYTRAILVTRLHAESENLGKPKKASVTTSSRAAQTPARRAIRYKRADE